MTPPELPVDNVGQGGIIRRPQQPSVGRDVHYVSRGSADGVYKPVCRAAKITEIPEYLEPFSPVGSGGDVVEYDGPVEPVHLIVFNPGGVFFDHDVPHDESDLLGGTWHWPERVGP